MGVVEPFSGILPATFNDLPGAPSFWIGEATAQGRWLVLFLC